MKKIVCKIVESSAGDGNLIRLSSSSLDALFRERLATIFRPGDEVVIVLRQDYEDLLDVRSIRDRQIESQAFGASGEDGEADLGWYGGPRSAKEIDSHGEAVEKIVDEVCCEARKATTSCGSTCD